MAMAEPENAARLVGVLKEIRDELRAVRIELGVRGAGTASGIRTEQVNRGGRWRSPALAAAGTAGLALIIGWALRDRPAPQPTTGTMATVAVGPQTSAPATPPRAAIPTAAPVALPAPIASHAPVPVARPSAAVTTKQTEPLPVRAPTPVPTTMAVVPAPAKKRLGSDSNVSVRPPTAVASDGDEPMAFPPPPRRMRMHRLSYGPVESEPAKL